MDEKDKHPNQGPCSICGKLSTLRCSKCRSVMYCGREHQVEHWPSHKASCVPAVVQEPAKTTFEKGYVTKESGLGGPGDMGMFATRDFQIGELVLAERPAFTLPSHFSMPTVGGAIQEVEKRYSDLSDAAKARFDALSNATPQLGRMGIFRTNALPLGDTTGVSQADFGGIFFEISRINHSCCPNVLHSWCASTKEERIFAVKPIKSGEQIFTTYVNDLFLTYAERQAMLHLSWNFSCHCHACLPQNRAQSDANRSKLAQLYEAFPHLNENPKMGKIVANEMLKLIEAEGQTEARFGGICYEAYQILIANRGNESAAKAFISKAYRGYLLSRGAEEATTMKMKGYYDNPQSHYAAGLYQ